MKALAVLVATAIVVAAITILTFPLRKVVARDLNGVYAENPQKKEWFDSLKSGKGLCCTDFDGRPPEAIWETGEGRYKVRIEGEWVPVPDDAVVQVPNRYGYAVVWYSIQRGVDNKPRFYIRCFLPGTLS
jgi:hypothetical protein